MDLITSVLKDATFPLRTKSEGGSDWLEVQREELIKGA